MIGGCDHIRYCGSPIALSFDETGKSKSVHLVSFENGRLSAVETLEVPVTQQLAVLKGDLASITRQLEQWRGVEQASPVWLAAYKKTGSGRFFYDVNVRRYDPLTSLLRLSPAYRHGKTSARTGRRLHG
jgi:exonuclease SbcD